MATQIKLRRDTFQNWQDNDPILAEGEPGLDLTNSKLKIGDGNTAWTGLPYFDDKENIYTNILSNVVPGTDSTYNLGSPSKRWNQLFVDNGAIYLGDIKITNDTGRLVVQQVTDPGLQTEAPVASAGIVTTDRIINGDHYLSINSSGDLFLDGVAYTELPTQTNNAGKFLTTNGSGTLSWSSSTGNTGDFVFTNSSASLPLGNTMTLNTYQNGGNGESKLTLSPTSESNLYVANILKLGVNYGSGSEHYWQFDAVGTLTTPGRIVTPEIEGKTDTLAIYSDWTKDTGISIVSQDTLESVTLTSDRLVAISTNFGPSQKDWIFEASGNLKLPAGGDIVDSSGVSVLGGSGGSSVTTGTTPPASPSVGDLWYDSNSGRTYVYFDASWVDANPTLSVPTELVNGAYTFSLGSNGSLTLPSGPILVSGYPGAGFVNDTAALAGAQVYLSSTDGTSWVGVENGQPSIGTAGGQWTFSSDGNLTIPNSSIIRANANGSLNVRAYTDTVDPVEGDLLSAGLYVSPSQISISYVEQGNLSMPAPRHQWDFHSVSGELQLAAGGIRYDDNTIQTTAYREPDVTNQFYVDPFAGTDYTPTGSILKPFKTIAAAQTEIEARITAETLVPGELNPIFIVVTGSITENVTLTRGHIFLTSLNGSIHTPIYLYGQITVNGSETGTGAIDSNHFAITGLTIVGPNQGACIYFTGTNAQRLMVDNIWLTARGSQTGTTPFTDAGGYGIYSDNSGLRASDGKHSPVHGSDIKISHTGTGDVYCFRFSNGSTGDFVNVETSGATQVGAVGSGSLLAFANSTLDANGEVILEAYGTGSLSVNNCIMSNVYTGVAYGIWLHSMGGNAIIINTIISVASSDTASRMIKGHATDPTGVFYNNIMVGKSTTYPYPDLNKKVDNTVVLAALTGAAGLTSVSP